MSHAPRSRGRPHSRTVVAALLALVAGLAAALVPAGPVAATSPRPPEIERLSSNHGPAAGGNEIVVDGYGIVGSGLGIFFGSNYAKIVSDGPFGTTVKVPPGLSGTTVPVRLARSGSDDWGPTLWPPLAYTYDGKTRLALKPSPDHGSPLGGTTVTFTGFGIDFRDPQSVTFGGAPAEVLSSTATSVTVKTPAGAAGGRVPVSLTTASGDFHGASWSRFQYDWSTERPTVTSIEGSPAAYGKDVTVRGSGFAGPTRVWVDGEPVATAVYGDTVLRFSAPRLPAGTYDVIVRSTVGDSANTAADDLKILPGDGALLTEISPNHGPAAAGTVVTIRGKGFATATKVEFGWLAGTDLEVISDAELRVKTPSFDGPYDKYDVKVTTAAGKLDVDPEWSRDDFTVDFTPGHLLLSPGRAPAETPTELTVAVDGIKPSHVGSIWLLRDGDEPQKLSYSRATESSFKVTLPPGAPGETVRLQARADGGSSDYGDGASLNGDGDPFRWDRAVGAFGYTIKGHVSLRTLARGSFGVTGAADLEVAADGSVHGPLTLVDASARLVSGGFLPVTAKLAFVPSGEAAGAFGIYGLWLEGKFRLKVKELKLFGAIPLIGGNTCQTKQLATIVLDGLGFTVADVGGRLISSFTLSDLNGCGALNSLVSPLTAGGGNTMTLDLTPRD